MSALKSQASADRYLSVDALRGADMAIILGLDYIVHYLFAWTKASPLGALSDQLRHADWAGVTAYDLVFPLFIFLAGVSLGIVVARRPPTANKSAFLWKAGRRALLLILLGILYNWGWRIELETIRFASVLGLIGGTYFIAAVAVSLTVDWRALVCITVAILGITTLAQLAIPTPGAGAGLLTPEGSINSWLDQALLPGRLHGETYDPEGLLGVFSGASITLAGVLAGLALAALPRQKEAMTKCVAYFFLAGLALILIGFALAPVYPPIKKIWTATFDIIAIGACLMLFAMAILIFEVWNQQKLGIGLAVIGANAILAYFGARYFIYPVYGPAGDWPPGLSAGVIGLLIVAMWSILAILYRRRIFLRV